MKIKISKSAQHEKRRALFIWTPLTVGLLVWCWYLADSALTHRLGA